MTDAPIIASHSNVRWRRVIVYYLLVYIVSYALVGGFLACGGSFRDPSWVFFAQASSLTPALMAIGLTRWLWREPVAASLGLRLRRDRWVLVAWLVPWGLSLLALAFGLAMPGVHWDGSLQPAVDGKILSVAQLDSLRQIAKTLAIPPILLLVPMGLLSSVTMSFVAGCGEEIGWRGFVHGELRPLGFWRNAIVTGVLWLGWHLPLLALGYGHPQHPFIGAGLMSVFLLIASVGYAYLRERAVSSIVSGLFHGTTEATMLLAVAPLAGGSDITLGMSSLSWIAAQLVVVSSFLVCDTLFSKAPIVVRRARERARTG
jgi:membrane protease YdiL (CAAX protease family)